MVHWSDISGDSAPDHSAINSYYAPLPAVVLHELLREGAFYVDIHGQRYLAHCRYGDLPHHGPVTCPGCHHLSECTHYGCSQDLAWRSRNSSGEDEWDTATIFGVLFERGLRSLYPRHPRSRQLTFNYRYDPDTGITNRHPSLTGDNRFGSLDESDLAGALPDHAQVPFLSGQVSPGNLIPAGSVHSTDDLFVDWTNQDWEEFFLPQTP